MPLRVAQHRSEEGGVGASGGWMLEGAVRAARDDQADVIWLGSSPKRAAHNDTRYGTWVRLNQLVAEATLPRSRFVQEVSRGTDA
jgi:hypothetical protein